MDPKNVCFFSIPKWALFLVVLSVLKQHVDPDTPLGPLRPNLSSVEQLEASLHKCVWALFWICKIVGDRSVTSCVITASPSLINSALRLLYVIDYWTHFSVGLRGLAEVQSWQRGEWGSRVCGSQWKSRADKIQEHQGKMEYTMREKSVALCLRLARPLDQRQASCLLLGNNFKVFSAHS